MVEGTPLLREHAAYTRIEGSNPSVSASDSVYRALLLQGLFFFAEICSYKSGLLNGVSVTTIITMEITFDPAKDKSNRRKHVCLCRSPKRSTGRR